LVHYGFAYRQLTTECAAFPQLQIGEIAMINAKQCRIYAAECRLLASSSDISPQRSLEQSVMALNWAALADEMDRENAQAKPAAFSALGAPIVSSSLARLTYFCRRAGEVAA
jgi:hypothetical protein